MAKPLSRIVVFCEGLTEKQYVEDFASVVGRRLIEVEVVPNVGVPSTVVRQAVERKRELEQQARRKDASSFDKQFTVWAVFDRDEHPCYYDALRLATTNSIHVAYSNPCIELWGLLHFQEVGSGHIERAVVQRQLAQVMKGYCHRTSPFFRLGEMMEGFELAKARAVQLLASRLDAGDQWGCPSTGVHELAGLITLSSKSPAERRHKEDELRSRIAEIEADPRYISGDNGLARERNALYVAFRSLQ